jgi:hypothetical protein
MVESILVPYIKWFSFPLNGSVHDRIGSAVLMIGLDI